MDSTETNLQRFKSTRVGMLPDVAGVYALCDLDGIPIYVGQAARTRDTSIRKRVQRHVTSARSDIIANRQLDVWEISVVMAWQVDDSAERTLYESQLFHFYDAKRGLVNGTVPAVPPTLLKQIPKPIKVQVLPDAVIDLRRDPAIRFPRQVQQFHQLLDYILNTQDKKHLRRALRVHHARLGEYLDQFLSTHELDDADEPQES